MIQIKYYYLQIKYYWLMKKILLILSTLFLASISFAETISCRHPKIQDGNNIFCLSSENKQIKVRLWGIDAPDLNQNFGKESAQILSKILSHAPLNLEVFGYDSDGRTLSEIKYQVYVDCPPPSKLEDGTMIQEIGCMEKPPTNANWEMIYRGYAWTNPSHKLNNANKFYIEAERIARKDKRGLWADPNPISPWEWRKAKKGQRK
ncbi:thermonuclease family protein [Neisseria sp. Ec49-e6-T10]|uniref:thermonuclease family protein n=1 Tax=Neisseria sp. Ec49-e6-T10 TaxID=3140744 RepID=UPI003EB96ADC